MGARVKIPQAAEATGLSEHAIRIGCKQGKYPHIRVGKRIIIDIDLLEQYLEQEAKDAVKPQEPTEIINYGKLRSIGG